MAEASIPVDLFNPRQVFACLGFLEAADVLAGEAAGGFDWSNGAETRFHLRAASEGNPFGVVLDFLRHAEVRSLAPRGRGLSTDGWGVPTVEARDIYPCPLPRKPNQGLATLPAVLTARSGRRAPVQDLVLCHWADDASKVGRDNVKFWAGMQGKPGSALARDSIDAVGEDWPGAEEDPFQVAAPQDSSFRFDWRRDYVPIDIGFSINSQKGKISSLGYPLVEILAVVGLSNARPFRRSKLEYWYAALGTDTTGMLYDPVLLRAALGCADLPFSVRSFRMSLDWPGQANQARCITVVKEEKLNVRKFAGNP